MSRTGLCFLGWVVHSPDTGEIVGPLVQTGDGDRSRTTVTWRPWCWRCGLKLLTGEGVSALCPTAASFWSAVKRAIAFASGHDRIIHRARW